MSDTALLTVLEKNWDLLEKSPDEKMLPAMKLLHEHLVNPRSYVTLAGETSSGKSTLINAFLKRKFLSAKARPTTGTVTWIDYGTSDSEKLYAINRDATVEELDYPTFLSLSENPDSTETTIRVLKDHLKGYFKKFGYSLPPRYLWKRLWKLHRTDTSVLLERCKEMQQECSAEDYFA